MEERHLLDNNMISKNIIFKGNKDFTGKSGVIVKGKFDEYFIFIIEAQWLGEHKMKIRF